MVFILHISTGTCVTGGNKKTTKKFDSLSHKKNFYHLNSLQNLFKVRLSLTFRYDALFLSPCELKKLFFLKKNKAKLRFLLGNPEAVFEESCSRYWGSDFSSSIICDN